MTGNVKVVAFGGGHGLAASLRALRTITSHLTAVVGVSDNGGSSGRLRHEFGLLPPGDLRMALTALCADDDWGSEWAQTLQHRFPGQGELGGHALGNLLITALWQRNIDLVSGLEAVGRLLGSRGTVLPLSLEPLDIVAEVATVDGIQEIRGQIEVATTQGTVRRVWLEPETAQPTKRALEAVQQADVLVFGPGSWFSSVLTSFALPQMREAISAANAKRILVANLCSQSGETEDFSPAQHLEVLNRFAPEVNFDVVVVDVSLVSSELTDAVGRLGAAIEIADLQQPEDAKKHNPLALAQTIDKHLPGFKERPL